MNFKCISLTAVALFYFSLNTLSQQSSAIKKQLDEHFEQAMRYKEISLYGESIGELDQVIKVAKKHGYKEKYIEASIAKAELFRKTENFDRGIELLYQLKDTKKYPKLHVQRLGRLAALYAEKPDFPKELKADSINAFVQEGIEISTRLGLKAEEAGLRNELGFSQSRAKKFDLALANLLRARRLYNEIGDEENEMGVSINIFDLYVGMDDFKTADSIHPILTKKIENTNWHTMKSKLYGIISIRYQVTGDLIPELKWAEESHKSTVAQARLMNSNQMASFRVIHDTEQFKEEAFQKSLDLERQKGKTQQLLLLSSILILIIAIVILIFFREKRLKLNNSVQDLNLMNDKYEMLIVESNHRIKNNLQMIISMLEFTRKGMEKSNTDIVQSMSGKIQTISALHKHLYVDVHNEYVDLDTYFTEIIEHYKNIGLKHSIDQSVSNVKVRSERIVYFGLILNEMLSNTLQHDVSNGLNIQLKIEKRDDSYLFNYSDGSLHQESTRKGMGTTLIKKLVGRIKGEHYQLIQNEGTYQFEFKTD
jgi:two-component sensor histidine kinase